MDVVDGSEFIAVDDVFAGGVFQVPGRSCDDDSGRVDRFAGERCEVDVLDERLSGGADNRARGSFGDEERTDQGAVALGDDQVRVNEDVHAAGEVERAVNSGFVADFEAGGGFSFGRRCVGTVPNACSRKYQATGL